jgi:hypothetical protein
MTGWKSRTKFALFCAVPALALLVFAEGVVRVAALARPTVLTLPLEGESHGYLRFDPDLFWSVRPNLKLSKMWEGAGLTTNPLGLRGDEVLPKQRGEFRILSLGESTAFSFGVSDGKTYSSVLQRRLRRADLSRPISVINAGITAYSSFQSLEYLKLGGPLSAGCRRLVPPSAGPSCFVRAPGTSR